MSPNPSPSSSAAARAEALAHSLLLNQNSKFDPTGEGAKLLTELVAKIIPLFEAGYSVVLDMPGEGGLLQDPNGEFVESLSTLPENLFDIVAEIERLATSGGRKVSPPVSG